MREKKLGHVGTSRDVEDLGHGSGGTLLADPVESYPKAVNTNSSPSTLKVTSVRGSGREARARPMSDYSD